MKNDMREMIMKQKLKDACALYLEHHLTRYPVRGMFDEEQFLHSFVDQIVSALQNRMLTVQIYFEGDIYTGQFKVGLREQGKSVLSTLCIFTHGILKV